jgi:hypothetical protein
VDWLLAGSLAGLPGPASRPSDLAPLSRLGHRGRASAAPPRAPAGAVPSVNASRGRGRGECAEPAPQTSAYLLYSRATPRQTPHTQHGPTAAQLNYGATRAVPTETPLPNVADLPLPLPRAAPRRAALHLTGAAPRRVQSRPIWICCCGSRRYNDEPEQLSSRASLTRSFPEPSSSHSQRKRRPRCPPTRSG